MKTEKVEKDIFINILRDYCKKHGSIFWKPKALALDKDTDTFYIPEKDCYYAVYTNKIRNSKMLTSYISNDEECHIPVNELNQLDCIQMSAEMFDKIKDKLTGFNANYGYGLIYDDSYIPPAPDTARYSHYSIVNFDFSNERHFIEAANIIEQDGDWMRPENIKKIMRQYKENSVFDPDLWIFVKDNFENKLIGNSISYLDKEISQTQIDWFHVSENFQGKGAGRFLISEAVRRVKDRTKYILAGGTNEFYKKCGFVERELGVWAAKEGFEFIASCVQPNVLP